MRYLLLLALFGILPVTAQDYDEILRLRKMQDVITGIRPTADGEHYTLLEARTVFRYSYLDGKGEALLPAPDSTDTEISDYLFSPNGGSILLSIGSNPIYRHSFTTSYHLHTTQGTEPILTQVKEPRDASFSPDGRWIVASGGNNLWLYNTDTRDTQQITTDGEWNKVINGTTDWVYEEEFSFTKAYAFSPDSRRIAYLRFDESAVPVFEMMRFDGTLHNKAYSFKYPKAGDPNSIVQVWVYDIETGKSTRIDSGPQTDQYILGLNWTPDGRLYFMRLNRLQNHLEVILCNNDGKQKTIFEEHSPRYVERINSSTLNFIDADRFIVREETSTGWMHLYLHSISRGRLNAITQGKWEVTELISVTPTKLYYTSTESSPLRRDLYSITLDGRNKKRLTGGDGYYTINPGKGMKYFISTFSNTETPNRIEVRAADGRVVRTLKTSEKLVEELAATRRPKKTFFSFVTERCDTLNGWMLQPRNFDPSKRYPVLLTQYSGPGSQMVADRWAVDWEDALVDEGYIVVCVDGRGTGFRGEHFKKQTYGNLGHMEAQDQLSTGRFMASRPYVDPARIGIYGWSFGGFTTLNCALKGHGFFKVAIAVAPVTTWRYYDTIYTELYNGLPDDNPGGYDDNSPINFAGELNDEKTRLLIIHGTADDNVHLQNTIELTRALNQSNKMYEMMIYPDQNHAMMPNDTRHIRQKMAKYIIEHL